MDNSTIHDLLPIPQGTRKPHPYQVFGLEPGEQDASTVRAAIASTVEHLKQAKASTDRETWNRAAKLVQQAKQILSDSGKKSELDARFGIVPVGNTPPPTSPTAAAVDPLAALLPASDPLAAVTPKPTTVFPPPPGASDLPPAAPTSELPPPSPAPMFGEVAAGSQGRSEPPATSAMVPPVVLKDAPPRTARPRRKSLLGSLIFALFSFTMVGLIALLCYFLLFGSGQVAISKSSRGVTITKGPRPADGDLAVNPPAASSRAAGGDPTAAPRRPRDRVMGRLAGDMPPPSMPIASEPPARVPPVDISPAKPSPPDTMVGEGDASPPASESTSTMEPPAVSIPASEMTDEMIAAADEAIVELTEILRAAKWRKMRPAAEQLVNQRLTSAQRERAEALHELADLADYYRGGIERGVASLEVGSEFAVTDAFRVITVETGENLLVIRFNARNRSYKFDEFPFALAHKLASFAMPADDATTQAAKAVYQSLAPKATAEHRQQAIEWLESIDEPVKGANPKRMVLTIESLFGDPR